MGIQNLNLPLHRYFRKVVESIHKQRINTYLEILKLLRIKLI
jgi:hypothetical protein